MKRGASESSLSTDRSWATQTFRLRSKSTRVSGLALGYGMRESRTMPIRRIFLSRSSAATCAFKAEEQPKTLHPIPEQAVSGGDIFEAACRGYLKRATGLAGQNPAIAKLRSA